MNDSSRHILGMRVDARTYATCTDEIISWAQGNEARYVCVSNVHMTMETVDDPAFREIVNSADLVTSDGMPLVWMLRKLGLKTAERVYGPQLVLHICERAEKKRIPIGLYGGTEASLSRFHEFLRDNYPELEVSYSFAPPFRSLTPTEDAEVVKELRDSGARILFVGIGCPKQERWMSAHRSTIQAVQIGVGAAFDFHSSAVKQAPQWMGKSGLEWLFRLAMEPRRLWRRYAIHNPRFIIGAALQLMRKNQRSAYIASVMPLFALLGLLGLLGSTPNFSRTYYVDQAHPAANDAGNGSAQEPFETITAALNSGLIGPGDSLIIGAGLYRESILPQSGGTSRSTRVVISARGKEEVIISGADRLGYAEFLSDSLWVINNYFPLDFYGDDFTYERELIVADGEVLKPVFKFDDLHTGSFFVDRRSPTEGRIIIDTGQGVAPSIETARRGSLFFPGDEYADCGDPDTPGWFHIIGLTFRHAANQAQTGAVCSGSVGSIFERVRIEWTNGLGMEVMGSGHELHNVSSNHNGQAGINGSCIGCLVHNSESSYNNWIGHDPFWEAGGGKWASSSNVQFMGFTAIGNDGPGLWLDGDNDNVAISYSLLDSNLVAGLFIELNSVNVYVERVTISRTRRLDWAGSGVLIQATGQVTLRNNEITENDGAGIWIRRDPRILGGHNRIEHNLFRDNARMPDQDRADIQIGAETLHHLCSNLIRDNILDETGSFFFEIEELGESISGVDMNQFKCLVDYSDY